MTDIFTITAHEHSYQIEDPGGLIGRPLAVGVPYEARVLEHIYRQELHGLAIDVGASVGNHSLWLAAICGLRVIAIEPLDYLRLVRNVALNPGLPVEVWPFALGDRSYRGTVTGAPAHTIGDSFPKDGLVSIQRLDDLMASRNDVVLLKIDVEGMEPQVLRGAARTIKTCQPLVFAEAQDGEAHARNAEVLDALGYMHTRTFGATPLEEWRPCP